MIDRCTHFLLVPDRGAARRIRRSLASDGTRMGVMVGTWPELLVHARQAYVLPAEDSDWEARLEQALAGVPGAFWSRSFRVARSATVAAVGNAFTEVLSALEPGDVLDPAVDGDLPARAGRHLADLGRLHAALGDTLPEELATIRGLLAVPACDAIRHLSVCWRPGLPRLSRWQAALVAKLNGDAGDARDAALSSWLAEHLPGRLRGIAGTALARLQADLYRPDVTPGEADDGLQWLGVRDPLEEAEVAAGMVQTLLASDPGLSGADVGLLLPVDPDYVGAVGDALSRGGIAVAGLPVASPLRDLGREVVFHFLRCARKPAPAMALAACLSSPLMPWGTRIGAVLAQTVMDGDYDLEPPAEASRESGRVLALLRQGAETAPALSSALTELAACLSGVDDLAAHRERALATIAAVAADLAPREAIDWPALLELAAPEVIPGDAEAIYTREGVTAWQEGQEPWRPVRHLIVLGLCEGHYPAPVPVSPIFSQDDLRAIRTHRDWPLALPAEVRERRRELFKRQLGAASESVTFLVPRRNGLGEPLGACESLVFMQRLFAASPAAAELVWDLDLAAERGRARYLPVAPAAPPTPPRVPVASDLSFGRNLLARRADGELVRHSPSRLETLMVSPLAWLLQRVSAEPALWRPEALDVLLKGTLAHDVFEAMFAPDRELPDPDAIPAQIGEHLTHAIRRVAPFLQSAQWRVERQHLERELVQAAGAWRQALAQLGARVVAAEVWLEGRLGKLPLHGQADAILALPGGRLLVVDYKKSGSRPREARMRAGYDSQLDLYRTMLETGGPRDGGPAGLAGQLADETRTGILYCMLNDGVLLSDEAPPEGAAVVGWRAIEGEVSRAAMALIDTRLGELAQGRVRLNRAGDEAFFTKRAGLKPYALENSPLIGLFTLPDDLEALE